MVIVIIFSSKVVRVQPRLACPSLPGITAYCLTTICLTMHTLGQPSMVNLQTSRPIARPRDSPTGGPLNEGTTFPQLPLTESECLNPNAFTQSKTMEVTD